MTVGRLKEEMDAEEYFDWQEYLDYTYTPEEYQTAHLIWAILTGPVEKWDFDQGLPERKKMPLTEAEKRLLKVRAQFAGHSGIEFD